MPFSGRMPVQNVKEPSLFFFLSLTQERRKEGRDGGREEVHLIRNNP